MKEFRGLVRKRIPSNKLYVVCNFTDIVMPNCAAASFNICGVGEHEPSFTDCT